MQEVFLRAFRNYSRLRLNSNHRAWLYKIATNRGLSKLRRLRNHRDRLKILEAAPHWHWETGADGPLREYAARRIRVLVENLPARQRTCVTLRYLQGMDYPEIARIAGCSKESARANVYQALRRLRTVLKEQK